MKTLFLIVSAVCFLFAGCNGNKNNKQGTIVQKGERKVENKQVKIQNDSAFSFVNTANQTAAVQVKGISYFPLLGSEQHILPEVDKMRVANNRIILGNRMLAKIVVYDGEGNFLFEISHRGHAKNEYLEMMTFTNTDRFVYTLDNSGNKICVYSLKDGEFVKTITTNFTAFDMEAFSDNDFLFTMMENNPKGKVSGRKINGAVWRTDSTMRIIETYLPNTDGYYEMMGKPYYFTKTGDAIMFHRFKDDGFYKFAKQGGYSFIPIELKRPIPSGDRDNYEKVQRKKYTFVASTPFATRHHYVFEVQYNGQVETVLSNLKDRVVARNNGATAHNGLLSISGVWGNRFVSYLNDYYFYESITSVGFKKGNQSIRDLLKKGGACLILYEMK